MTYIGDAEDIHRSLDIRLLPTRFLVMLTERGGNSIAKALFNSSAISYGLTRLWIEVLSDLSVEGVVLHSRRRPLFSFDELARRRCSLIERATSPLRVSIVSSFPKNRQERKKRECTFSTEEQRGHFDFDSKMAEVCLASIEAAFKRCEGKHCDAGVSHPHHQRMTGVTVLVGIAGVVARFL